jgi:proteasome assembly chaperone (PAC2) family protein
MTESTLNVLEPPLPAMPGSTLLLALSGWMDGGDVSTGTVQRLVQQQRAEPVAEIESDGFYIDNFPGTMEISALFRPHVRIAEGMIQSVEAPGNVFYADRAGNLLFFDGREPNLHWRRFGDGIFQFARLAQVTRIIFVGSFGGTVPHTREPRLFATISEASLRPLFARYKLRPSNYEGPGSFATYLMAQAGQHGMQMISLVAEIPGYLQGANPLSIEAVTRRLAAILGLEVDLARLRSASDEWESRVTAAVENDPELAERIKQLERDYDDELLNTSTPSEWLEDREP